MKKNSNHPKLTKKISYQKIMMKSGIKIKLNKTKGDKI